MKDFFPLSSKAQTVNLWANIRLKRRESLLSVAQRQISSNSWLNLRNSALSDMSGYFLQEHMDQAIAAGEKMQNIF